MFSKCKLNFNLCKIKKKVYLKLILFTSLGNLCQVSSEINNLLSILKRKCLKQPFLTGMTPPPHLPPLCQRIFDYVWRHFCCCHKRINQNFYLIPSIHDVALVVQSLNCVRLFYNSMDYSSPDSYVHGVSQARILEWVAISFSRGSSHPEIESASPALAGRFFTTEPLGKPLSMIPDDRILLSMIQDTVK